MNWKNILLNTLAIFVGLIIGGMLNGYLIEQANNIIPFPEGYDNSTMEVMQKTMHLLEPKHFVMPFVAHALGTLVGAFVAALISPNYKLRYALFVAVFFLLGGITMVYYVGGPIEFILLDLILAYIPMGYLGYIIATQLKR